MTPRILSTIAVLLALSACDLDALLGNGDECSADSDCNGSDLCDSGECVECENDRDCDDDEECNDGDCDKIGEGEGEGEGDGGEGEGDGGEGEGEAGCGTTPTTGECIGNTARFCNPDTNTVDSENCSDSGLTCQQAFGINICAADLGDSCVTQGPDGALIQICADEGAGCELQSLTDAQCVSGGPTCAATDVNRCIGQLSILVCIEQIGQAAFLDCAAAGAVCDATAGGCLFAAGATCVPNISACGEAATSTVCPESGLCP